MTARLQGELLQHEMTTKNQYVGFFLAFLWRLQSADEELLQNPAFLLFIGEYYIVNKT